MRGRRERNNELRRSHVQKNHTCTQQSQTNQALSSDRGRPRKPLARHAGNYVAGSAPTTTWALRTASSNHSAHKGVRFLSYGLVLIIAPVPPSRVIPAAPPVSEEAKCLSSSPEGSAELFVTLVIIPAASLGSHRCRAVQQKTGVGRKRKKRGQLRQRLIDLGWMCCGHPSSRSPVAKIFGVIIAASSSARSPSPPPSAQGTQHRPRQPWY